jgi:hypothetical protein
MFSQAGNNLVVESILGAFSPEPRVQGILASHWDRRGRRQEFFRNSPPFAMKRAEYGACSALDQPWEAPKSGLRAILRVVRFGIG